MNNSEITSTSPVSSTAGAKASAALPLAENQPPQQHLQQSSHEPEQRWPFWNEMTMLGPVDSVARAMDTYYKHDRLNRDGGTRERLIADREETLAARGFDIIASCHDSVNGSGMYIRKLDNELVVYMSNR